MSQDHKDNSKQEVATLDLVTRLVKESPDLDPDMKEMLFEIAILLSLQPIEEADLEERDIPTLQEICEDMKRVQVTHIDQIDRHYNDHLLQETKENDRFLKRKHAQKFKNISKNYSRRALRLKK